MKIRLAALAALIMTFMLNMSQVNAHHAFAAEFDADSPVLLKGQVSKVELINPHSWIHVDVKNDDGSVEEWMVEGGTPNTLYRAGVTRKSLPIGTDVIVRGYQSKDKVCEPKCKANGRDITLSNGEKVFMGSSGTGAPSDGSDPTER
ncbi:hypothetical protein NBRC116493_08070 [Aurantivibrio infirmus]